MPETVLSCQPQRGADAVGRRTFFSSCSTDMPHYWRLPLAQRTSNYVLMKGWVSNPVFALHLYVLEGQQGRGRSLSFQ